MGFGGINCHVTIESGDAPAPRLEPAIDERTLMASYQETELFVLTAPSAAALRERARQIRELAITISMAEMIDLAVELAQAADPAAPVRAAVVAGMPSDLVQRLELLDGLAADDPPGAGELRVAPLAGDAGEAARLVADADGLRQSSGAALSPVESLVEQRFRPR